MYLEEIAEVAIGLIFVWLVFSIATMQIQEWIANILAKRSSDLERVIREILNDPDKVQEFYNHPLIKSLSKPKKLSTKQQAEVKKLEGVLKKQSMHYLDLTGRQRRRLAFLRQRPSYIPSRNFALAVFDIVTKAGTSASPIRTTMHLLESQIEKLKTGDKEAARKLLDGIYELGQTVARSKNGITIQNSMKQNLGNLVNDLGKIDPQVATLANNLVAEIKKKNIDFRGFFKSDLALDQVRAGAIALGDSELGKSIDSLLLGVEEYATNADKALAIGRKNVEEWFDSSMDRMSGWYKRWSQKVVFVIGLFLAITLNVDSIALAQHLWREPAVRQALAANAEKFMAQNETLESPEGKPPSEAISTFQKSFDGLTLPIGWKLVKHTGDETVRLFAKPNEIAGICPPMDINWLEPGMQRFCYQIIDPPSTGTAVFVKILGFLFTALAAMQGAPFWFDMLKKLVNVRSSGINPAEKTKKEEEPVG